MCFTDDCFKKTRGGYKPLGRVPVDFQNVKVNDEVWVSRDKEGYIYRVRCTVLWLEIVPGIPGCDGMVAEEGPKSY